MHSGKEKRNEKVGEYMCESMNGKKQLKKKKTLKKRAEIRRSYKRRRGGGSEGREGRHSFSGHTSGGRVPP